MHISKLASAAAILALLLANPVFAGAFTPTDCPTVEQILNKVARSSPATHCDDLGNCTYDINSDDPIYTVNGWSIRTAWYFFMDLKASSVDEAKAMAATALQSLTYKSGPTFETNTLYFCRYSTINGAEAIAVYY